MTIRKAYVDGPYGQIHLRQTSPVAGTRTLVCLHATAYSSQTFLPLLEAYEGIRHVVAIDAPGYGASDAPKPGVDMAGYALALATAIPQCSDGPVDLLGYHTGAYMAAQLALAAPDRIAAMVMIGIPYFEALDFAYWRERLGVKHELDDSLDQFNERWDYLVTRRPAGLTLPRAFANFVDELKAWPNGWWAHHAMFDWNANGLLPRVRQPVLVLNPAGHLAQASRVAASLMPNARVEEVLDLEGAIFDVAPQRIMGLIDDFTGSVAPDGKRPVTASISADERVT